MGKHSYSKGNATGGSEEAAKYKTVSYTHLRAHETKANLVCRLLLEKQKKKKKKNKKQTTPA